MGKDTNRYEIIYIRLKKCFDILFGNGKNKGKMSMNEVRDMVMRRRRADWRHNLPGNSLIEIPNNLFEELKNTYIIRDKDCVSGPVGCAETSVEQLDGITNMALLMYLSNCLKNKYMQLMDQDISDEKKELYRENKNVVLGWKDDATTNIIATMYVLSKTDEEYENYFSYGNRIDDEGKSTFVVDLPYIGQLCVHYGNKKEMIVNNAHELIKQILQKKLKLGQITEEQLKDITSELDPNSILPDFQGKLYEYVGAMPIEYIGENVKKCRAKIGNKLPEEITSEDIQIMREEGLNPRELYYFFIKIGASKELLNEISGISKKITPELVEDATEDITISEFHEATQEFKGLAEERGEEKDDSDEKSKS